MKMSTFGGKHWIQWTAGMQLDDLDFADDLTLSSYTQQQMQKTTSVAAASTAHAPTESHDEEALEDVKTSTYLGSIIDEHGGEGADRQSKSSIFTTEEHLELKATVSQHQSQDFQYKCQDSSTVWGGNLEIYESHHPEDTSVYQQLST
ncbi:unnamed protein product [Schistosoma margrebowiei]|uniref:Uncharacterized protein n=1 Tax=Schistosoma margrebowiei TaxID=48269 RepID=A0A183N6L6_9TREM|nr:unnamed protein product [Schistosoma margrebowiei]